MTSGTTKAKGKRNNEAVVALLLVVCVAVVAFWEIMSRRSKRPFDPFEVTARDFASFAPSFKEWTLELLPVNPDPVEPNILIMRLRRRPGSAAATGRQVEVISRLVHGYNMPDCMRIKQYEVALVADSRRGAPGESMPQGAAPAPSPRLVRIPHQLWRLMSSTGDASVWLTSMLRVGDFGPTDVDCRSMAFPRIGIADNPGWFPRGFSWRDLRHPVRNTRLFLRAKWNASRADWLTFLGLRRPAWASDELLTLVTYRRISPVGGEPEAMAVESVAAVHALVHGALLEWRQQTAP